MLFLDIPAQERTRSGWLQRILVSPLPARLQAWRQMNFPNPRCALMENTDLYRVGADTANAEPVLCTALNEV